MESEMISLANEIVEWLKNYALENNRKAFVVGVSGGVDSALVSTLCAMTGIPTHCVKMPCQTKTDQTDRGSQHIAWLIRRFSNVVEHQIDLTSTFESFFAKVAPKYNDPLAFANTKSRLRMIALYQIATCVGGLVVGTGNKVEDFGIGFFTKYGDGGVDISPIADLMKSDVRQMARELTILPELSDAISTDGLWADGRSDEDAIGATYDELQWAMDFRKNFPSGETTGRDGEVLAIYDKRHAATLHKLNPIPTFKRQ